MIKGTRSLIPAMFLAGWATYGFSLFDVGRFSITLLLLASLALALSGFRLSRTALAAFACLLFSCLLAWFIALAKYPELEKTFTHLAQCMVAIGVMTGAASINWEKELPRLRAALLFTAIVVLAYGFYQIAARRLLLPGAFLPITNLQLATDEGLQRGFSHASLGAPMFTRVSSFFPEPSDLGRFMLWVFAFGYACRRGKLKFLLMGTGVAGIILSQSMGGLVGLAFLVSLTILLKRDFRGFVLAIVFFGGAVAGFSHFWPEETEQVKTRAETIAVMPETHLAQTGRFAYVGDHFALFQESPILGYGLASIKKVTDPSSVVVNACMFQLLERGIVGSILFFGPFLWCFVYLSRLGSKRDEITNTALLILIVEIFCFSTFAMVYFPPIYLALGLALNRAGYARIHGAREHRTDFQER